MMQAFTGNRDVNMIIQGEVDEFWRRYRQPMQLPVGLDLRARFNPELNKTWFGALTELINQITLLSIILTGAALIREREHGTIEHLLVMPVTPFEIMVRVWSMALVAAANAVVDPWSRVPWFRSRDRFRSFSPERRCSCSRRRRSAF
jgi:ABC-2 type transport system permease protein